MEFGNRLEAKVIIQDWRRHYNEIRPNSRLNYRTPTEFIAGLNSNLSTETRQIGPVSEWVRDSLEPHRLTRVSLHLEVCLPKALRK